MIGVWGQWGAVGKCIRKHGSCKRIRQRQCDSHSLSNDDASCTGMKHDSVKCHPKSCGI